MCTFLEIQDKLELRKDEIGISWTGQAGFAFKDSQGKIYHIDPYLSNVCSTTVGYHRVVPTPINASELKVDFIFVTHEHKDHLDDVSLPLIAKANKNLTIVAPPTCIDRLKELGIHPKRLISLQRGEDMKIGNTLVKAVIANHTDDSVGFVFKFGNLSFYITGDTTYSDNLIAVKEDHPNLMMPCINGRLGCMNICDAVRLTGHIQPDFVVPMHYGMFKENTADPNEFVRQAETSSGITKGMIINIGEWYAYSKRRGFTKYDFN